MKNLKNLILLGAILLTFSCKKEDKTAATSGGGGSTTVTKELFSTSWSLGAWDINLSLGDLSGNPFQMQSNFTNGDQCVCTAIMTGTQSAGSYRTTSCLSVTNNSGTNDNANCQSIFGYNTNGRYTNSNGYLNFCRSITSNCTLTYH